MSVRSGARLGKRSFLRAGHHDVVAHRTVEFHYACAWWRDAAEHRVRHGVASARWRNVALHSDCNAIILPFASGLSSTFLIGLSIPIAQSYLPGRFDDYSLFVLTIYCVGVHAMMGLRFPTASAISVALFGIYIGVIALKTPLPQPFVISAALWCFAVQLLAMRISYLDERSRKRDFFRNQL